LRLIDMGVEPYLVSSTLAGSMAQRLVRKICPKCKTERATSVEKLPRDFPRKGKLSFHVGQGCPHCRNTGYRGRMGLFELLAMNDDLAQKIIQRAPIPKLIAAGRCTGLRLLREDGWVKVQQGLTTIEEVLTCTAV
jgi:type II secretory ATPase GspE/PulE/Tfp pilus assembly ATPase PilB-like protein